MITKQQEKTNQYIQRCQKEAMDAFHKQSKAYLKKMIDQFNQQYDKKRGEYQHLQQQAEELTEELERIQKETIQLIEQKSTQLTELNNQLFQLDQQKSTQMKEMYEETEKKLEALKKKVMRQYNSKLKSESTKKNKINEIQVYWSMQLIIL